ncbi:MAG: sensor histidine kinase, partial [Bacteriovoracia bacterium]
MSFYKQLKIKIKDKVNNLTVLYIFALSSIALITILNYFVLRDYITTFSYDREVILTTEKLKDASEDVYNIGDRIEEVDNKLILQNYDDDLAKEIIEMEKQHRSLLNTFANEPQLQEFNSTLDAIFYQIRQSVDDILEHIDGLQRNEVLENKILDQKALLLKRQQTSYKNTLRSIIDDYGQSARNRLSNFNLLETLIMIVTLIILLLMAIFIFKPAVDKMYHALQARSHFLSRISHEIRNPMNSIIGMTDLILETKLNVLQKKYVENLYSSAQNLLEMLNNLVDFSALEGSQVEVDNASLNLQDLFEKCTDIIALRVFQRDLEIIIDFDPELYTKITGDMARLQQILLNLLGNSIKFTEEGEITLRAKLINDEQGEKIQFEVKDTGIGIPQEKQNQIFDSFVQGDSSIRRRYGGSGLGLYISKRLVDLMGGNLTIESTEGLGSTFSFTIDIVNPSKQRFKDLLPNIENKNNPYIFFTNSFSFKNCINTMLNYWQIKHFIFTDVDELDQIAEEIY